MNPTGSIEASESVALPSPSLDIIYFPFLIDPEEMTNGDAEDNLIEG